MCNNIGKRKTSETLLRYNSQPTLFPQKSCGTALGETVFGGSSPSDDFLRDNGLFAFRHRQNGRRTLHDGSCNCPDCCFGVHVADGKAQSRSSTVVSCEVPEDERFPCYNRHTLLHEGQKKYSDEASCGIYAFVVVCCGGSIYTARNHDGVFALY